MGRIKSNGSVFFFNDTATTEIYTLSLHDALPICLFARARSLLHGLRRPGRLSAEMEEEMRFHIEMEAERIARSEEHTSELQSRQYLACRLLIEKKKYISNRTTYGFARP